MQNFLNGFIPRDQLGGYQLIPPWYVIIHLCVLCFLWYTLRRVHTDGPHTHTHRDIHTYFRHVHTDPATYILRYAGTHTHIIIACVMYCSICLIILRLCCELRMCCYLLVRVLCARILCCCLFCSMFTLQGICESHLDLFPILFPHNAWQHRGPR